jgi:hypothetical protein
MTAVRPRRRRRAAVGDAGQVARELLTVRAMSVPFARGLGGRQGARAVNSERADLDDLPSALVGLVLGVALQASSQTNRQQRTASALRTTGSGRLKVAGALGQGGKQQTGSNRPSKNPVRLQKNRGE